MTRAEFITFAEDLAGYYGRKMEAHRAALVFPKVSHVPSEAVEWIKGRITDEAETMPSNLGKAVLGGWQAWLMDNPDRRARPEAQECPECHHGILLMVGKSGMTAVFGCEACNQAPVRYPRARRGDLLHFGWTMQPSETAHARANGKTEMPATRIDDEYERARRMRHIPESEQRPEWAPF